MSTYVMRNQSESHEISVKDVQAGAAIAQSEMYDGVLESTLLDLSRGDRDFLSAMLVDKDETLIADVIERTGKSANSVQKTKRRLLDLGVIGERGRGIIAFELPFFKEFLQARSL
jgi:predicted transcriptional regulator